MHRLYLIALLCSPVAALLGYAPALGQVTSATISVSPANYSGSCPTSIVATAVVNGSAGSAFKYAFYRNGKVVLPTVGGVVGAAGAVTLRDTISLSSSASDFDQIWITGNGGGPDVYSNKATYSVTCATPGPPGHSLTAKSNVPPGVTQNHIIHQTPPLKIVTLQPAHETSFYRDYNGCTGFGNFESLDCENDQIQRLDSPNYTGPEDVGFRYWTDKSLLGDKHANSLMRAAYYFDLPNLQHHVVTKATLVLTRSASRIYSDGQWDLPSSLSCADSFGTAPSDWWDNNTQWLDGDFGENFSYSGSSLVADVNHDVAVWSAFGNNFGWIVKGPDENLGAFTEKECISGYTAILHIEYY
jgi:hypothetical protein